MSHQAAHDAALVAAAVQAAIREGAPRRTVAVVASAAVGALASQADRPVQLPTVNEEHTWDAQGMNKDACGHAVLLTALRAARRAQRLRKKERCREAKLAGLPVRPVPAPGVAVVDDAGDVSMASQAGGLSVASATDPLTSSASWAPAAGGLSVAAAADPLASSATWSASGTGSVVNVPGYRGIEGLHVGSVWHRCLDEYGALFLNCQTGKTVYPDEDDLPPEVAAYVAYGEHLLAGTAALLPPAVEPEVTAVVTLASRSP